jgi:hypothetical protein
VFLKKGGNFYKKVKRSLGENSLQKQEALAHDTPAFSQNSGTNYTFLGKL